MCIPGYWLAGFHAPRRAAPAAVPAGLGHAGLRLPRRPRRGARRRAARRSRSPATAASCSPAASWPRWPRSSIPLTAVIVDDGGYGMLRYDQAAAPATSPTASTSTRRTSPRWRRPSACGPRPSTGSTTSSARRSPRTSPTPARACSSRARRRPRRRRPTPRRTGIRKRPASALEAEVQRRRRCSCDVHLGLLQLPGVVPVHRLPAGELVEHPDAGLARAVAGLAVAAERAGAPRRRTSSC